MLGIKADNRHYIFFVLVSILFLITINITIALEEFYSYGFIFSIIAVALFFAYVFIYLIDKKNSKRRSTYLDVTFVLSVMNFISMVLITLLTSNSAMIYILSNISQIIIGALIIVPIAFSLFLGAYLIRKKIAVKVGYLLLAVALIILIIYGASALLLVKYHLIIDDETLISYISVKSFISGANPYLYQVSQQIYSNRTLLGGHFSFTTNDQIINVLNYPALFMFANLPFYFITKLTTYNLEYLTVPIQEFVFLFILLVVIAFSVEKKHIKSPPFVLMIFLILLFANIASITTYLMLALLILAYKYTGTKYSWVLFGLCLAIQELLWVPIILLLVYSANNYGFKKASLDVLGAVVVFLIINGYFIALGPSAFLSGVFNPIGKLLFPITASPISFLMLSNYQILITSYSTLFTLSILAVIVLYAYFSKKILIGLFSIVPFLFLSHALNSYFVFFVAFLFVTTLMEEEKHNVGFLEKLLHEKRILVPLAIIALLLVSCYLVYSSHILYSKAFDISVKNQSLSYNSTSNESVYKATIYYNNLSTSSIYLMFYGYTNRGSIEQLGINNQSIIATSQVCSSGNVTCMVNPNRIYLNGSGAYTIKANLSNSNQSSSLNDVRMSIYTGEYFYMPSPVLVSKS
jgi:hypothetical protein